MKQLQRNQLSAVSVVSALEGKKVKSLSCSAAFFVDVITSIHEDTKLKKLLTGKPYPLFLNMHLRL